MPKRVHTRRREHLYRTPSGMDVFVEGHRLDTTTGLMHFREIRVGNGVVQERDVTVGPWREIDRTNCWCCTCDEPKDGRTGRSDPACRLHGWWGRRPCEEHGTPGKESPEGDEPESVQQYRKRRAEVPPACRSTAPSF